MDRSILIHRSPAVAPPIGSNRCLSRWVGPQAYCSATCASPGQVKLIKRLRQVESILRPETALRILKPVMRASLFS